MSKAQAGGETCTDLQTQPTVGPPLQLAVVVPTLNERPNILELVSRLRRVLEGISWELIFVDDDSVDGTALLIEQLGRTDRRLRVIRRIGRRGLSSACIEGMLSTSAPFVAVMDADLQHDETILPLMLSQLRAEDLHVVVGTRNACGGSMGEFAPLRRRISEAGRRISNLVCRCHLSDPMSGFFVLDRNFFLRASRRMYGGGFKILVDLLASSPETPRVAEMGYRFRLRQHGESKLDLNTAAEYFLLIMNKLTDGLVPARFILFVLVGAAGVITHLLVLSAMLRFAGTAFLTAQAIAALVAMTENFFINNLVTFHDARLRGWRMWLGLLSFVLVCALGGCANLLVAQTIYTRGGSWLVAGLIGTAIGALWNYSVSSIFTWKRRERPDPLSPDGASLPVEVNTSAW